MKIHKIFWRDISSLDGSWLSIEEIIKQGKTKYDDVFITVGYIVEDNEDFLAVSSTRNVSDNEFADTSIIPKSVVVKIEELFTIQFN